MKLIVGSKFQVKQTILIFGKKFQKKDTSGQKLDKIDITIEFCMSKLVPVSNFILNKDL